MDEQMYALLVARAREQKTTMGDLVRKAVGEKYAAPARDRRKLVKRAVGCWKYVKNPFKGIDYKELVEYGRKY